MENCYLLPTTYEPKAKIVKWHLMWSLTLFKGAVSVCLILYHWAISAAISYPARLSTPIYILDTRKLFCRNFHQFQVQTACFLLADANTLPEEWGFLWKDRLALLIPEVPAFLWKIDAEIRRVNNLRMMLHLEGESESWWWEWFWEWFESDSSPIDITLGIWDGG